MLPPIRADTPTRFAGLGILALLTGDAETARARLEDALAMHVLTRDTPRENALRGMMALLPSGSTSRSTWQKLTKQVEQLRATGQGWRQALLLARLGLAARARGDRASERAHLVEARAAAGLSRMSASALVATLVGEHTPSASGIVIGFEGRSLLLPSAEAHDLTRHGPLRRMLWALAVARSERPALR